MALFRRHLFICTNLRDAGDERGCCAARGSKEVAAAFKEAVHRHGQKRIVRANQSGCLDQCAHGVTVVVYPDQVWYGGVRVEDVEEIVLRHLVGGEPVERLRIPEEELTGLGPAPTP
jgi:(2Fe-2S) ferredoxin